MIITINEFKNNITEINNYILDQIYKLKYSTKLIFGKFGTTDMYNTNNFYNAANGNIDLFIDSLPTKRILLNKIYPTQNSISKDKVKNILIGNIKNKNDLPFVIHNKLGYFLLDGHNRLSIAKLKNDKYVNVKVFEDL